MKPQKFLLQQEHKEEIRAAYRKGKRTIEILGVKFNIAKITRKPTFSVGGETKHQTEQWLTLKRTDGGLVPCANIEFKHQGNMRTVRHKS